MLLVDTYETEPGAVYGCVITEEGKGESGLTIL